jgi:hypothetical protein
VNRELPDTEAELLTAFQKLDRFARGHEGVRIMAPTGELGYVPPEKVDEAIAAGARLMTPDDMRILRQQVFMEHGLFKEAHQAPEPRRRKSLVKRRSR